MKKETQMTIIVAIAAVVVIVVVAIFLFGGGGGKQPPPAPQQPPMGGQPPMPLGQVTPPPSQPPPGVTQPPQKEVAAVPFRPRRDPFVYLPEELEKFQIGAFERAGYYRVAGPPKPPEVPIPEPYEPQPYRRVAGILEEPTISAILEEENGTPPIRVVKPGDMVGDFRVASLDMNGLTLKRNKGNPREVRVPYEPPQQTPGGGVAAAGGAPGAPGFAPGGAPGGMPPGAPGGGRFRGRGGGGGGGVGADF